MSSRVARKPIEVPAGVNISVAASKVSIKGPKGELIQDLPEHITVNVENNQVAVVIKAGTVKADAIAGTMRALINNHIVGVTAGFHKKLLLVGVGYRAQVVKAKDGRWTLNLTLGLSHPVVYIAPHGIDLASNVVTEIEVTGINRQLVGQVAADIRGICGGLRKPEPYKGKGIRYSDEVIVLKETKKK